MYNILQPPQSASFAGSINTFIDNMNLEQINCLSKMLEPLRQKKRHTPEYVEINIAIEFVRLKQKLYLFKNLSANEQHRFTEAQQLYTNLKGHFTTYLSSAKNEQTLNTLGKSFKKELNKEEYKILDEPRNFFSRFWQKISAFFDLKPSQTDTQEIKGRLKELFPERYAPSSDNAIGNIPGSG